MSRDLASNLKHMADDLAPSDTLTSEVKRIIDRLTRNLHDSRFRWHHLINRAVPLGSFAKKTSLRIMMDLDLVVYLNEGEYPYEQFLNDLDAYLTMHDSYEDCVVRGINLTFVAEGTLHVDLLPARNMVPRNEESRGQRAQQLQYHNMMQYIKNSCDPFNEGWKNSTGLSETAVEFVKRKNEKFHAGTLARLAKLWSKTVCVEEFHSGRSTIMEYISIRAAEIEQRNGRENTLKAFRRFLSIIGCQEEKINIFWTDYYDDSGIDDRMKGTRPLLLDPTNPFNNILRGKNKGYMQQMESYARVTLGRLDEAECQALRGGDIDMNAIFQHQPSWMYLPIISRPSAKKPRNFYVGVHDGDGGLLMPKTVKKSGAFRDTDREIIENFLFSFTDITATSSKKKGERNVAEIVQRDVQKMIAPDTSWGPGGEGSNKDARMEIPFKDENGRDKVLKVSFDMA